MALHDSNVCWGADGSFLLRVPANLDCIALGYTNISVVPYTDGVTSDGASSL